jgi:hypothetical protein
MIYASRPRACSAFQCFWRASDIGFTDDYFPARCGFVMSINNANKWPFVITVHPDPKRPDAWNETRYLKRFAELAYALNCLVAIGQGATSAHVITPAARMYSRAANPTLFHNGFVGAPDFDFREGVRPTLTDIGRVLLLGEGLSAA